MQRHENRMAFGRKIGRSVLHSQKSIATFCNDERKVSYESDINLALKEFFIKF